MLRYDAALARAGSRGYHSWVPGGIMELEVTWGRATLVWWSYFWRSLIGMFVAAIIGGVIGGILGFVLAVAGASAAIIKIVAMPIGAVIGLGISIVPIKMILGKDFGEFRLVLVSTQEKIPL